MNGVPHKKDQCTHADGSRASVEQAGKIAGCTLLSRLLGLVRDVMIIMALGVGADIFFMAFRVPNIMRRMAAEGVLGMAHAATLGRMSVNCHDAHYEMVGDKNGIGYSFKMALVYGGITALVACFLGLFAPACMKLVAPGFDQGRLQEAVYLFRWCLVYIPLASATAVLASALIHYGLAGYAALAPLLLNVGIITLGLGAFMAGDASFFAVGVVVGGGLQLVWVIFWAYRLLILGKREQSVKQNGYFEDEETLRISPKLSAEASSETVSEALSKASLETLPESSPEASAQKLSEASPETSSRGATAGKEVGTGQNEGDHQVNFGVRISALARVCLTVAVGSSAYLYFFMSSVGASFFAEGAVSSLYIGERFIEFPLAIIASSIGMAFMPQFSRLAHDSQALQESLWRTVRLSCLVCFPATIGITALHKPIIFLFFGHGAMDASEALMTARMFAVLGCALPAFCLSRQFIGMLISLSGTKIAPAHTAYEGGGETLKKESEGQGRRLLRKMGHSVWLGCLVVLAVSGALGWLLGLGAVALGVVVAAWGQCLYVWGLVQREIAFESPLAFARRHLPYLLALLVLFGGLWLVGLQLENIANRWFAGGVLCAVILGVALGWIKGCALFGNTEACALWDVLRKLWGRKNSAKVG